MKGLLSVVIYNPRGYERTVICGHLQYKPKGYKGKVLFYNIVMQREDI